MSYESRIRLGAILVVAVLVLVAWLGLYKTPDTAPGDADPRLSPNPVQDGATKIEHIAPEAVKPTGTVVSHPPTGLDSQRLPTSPGSPDFLIEPVILRVADADLLPVPGLELAICAESATQFQSRLEDKDCRPADSDWVTTTTDHDGRTLLPNPSDGALGVAFRVRLNTRGWILVTPSTYLLPLPEGEFGYLTSSRDRLITLQARRDNRVRLTFKFADGVAVSGDMVARIGTKQSGYLTMLRDITEHEAIEVSVPVDAEDMEIVIHTERRGFAARHTEHIAEPQIRPHIEVVVPPDPRQCWLEVDLIQWPAIDVEVSIVSELFTAQRTGSVPGGTRWGVPLSPTSGWCYVRVRTEGSVWLSEPVRLSPGETRTVLALYQKSVSYALRVLDTQGQPIRGARASFQNNGYFPWQEWRAALSDSRPEEYAGIATGNDGYLMVTGWPASVIEMYVDALGFEHKSIPLRPIPGQVVDLGTIVLEAARGQLVITLEGQRAGVEYAMFLYSPYPHETLEFRRGKPLATISLAAIPLRKYMVRVQAGSGGEGVNIDVELTSSNPSQTIEVDVSAFKTAEERRAASGG